MMRVNIFTNSMFTITGTPSFLTGSPNQVNRGGLMRCKYFLLSLLLSHADVHRAEWHKEVPYSGIWIDMSEVSSFCVGSCGTGNVTMNPVHPPFKLPGEVNNVIYEYPEAFNITNSTEAASAS